jgi:hypothetical protein
MKKLLTLTLSLASLGFVASAAEAKTTEAASSPATAIVANMAAPQRQWEWNRRDDRRNRRVRVVTQTRFVRLGRQVFRETYQVRYLPNGQTRTRLISRIRVR